MKRRVFPEVGHDIDSSDSSNNDNDRSRDHHYVGDVDEHDAHEEKSEEPDGAQEDKEGRHEEFDGVQEGKGSPEERGVVQEEERISRRADGVQERKESYEHSYAGAQEEKGSLEKRLVTISTEIIKLIDCYSNKPKHMFRQRGMRPECNKQIMAIWPECPTPLVVYCTYPVQPLGR